MSVRLVPLLLALGPWASIALAQQPLARLTEVGKDAVRFELSLETPGAVELEYGEELFAWEGRAESLVPGIRHELSLSKLIPNRQYFYRLLVDGVETGEVLTFRSGRSWIDHEALVLVTADTPSGARAEQLLAQRMFGEEANALIALGGDGGDPETFLALHGRSQGERLVVECGGTGDLEALRSLAVSDMAIASVGESPLVLPDGKPAPAASWLATALPALEGACWSVVASARPVVPDSDEARALLAWAKSAGVQVLLTRGASATLSEHEGLAWLALPDPDGEEERAIGRLVSSAETLTVKLETASGALLGQASFARRCPIPASLLSAAAAGAQTDDDPFGEGSSDLDDGAEECDY